MSVNLLNRALLENTRTEAKKVFRELVDGRTVALTNVKLEDESMVRMDLAMDHSEFPGKINFRAFRTSLAVLLSNYVEALKNPESIKTFNKREDPSSMLFGITSVVVDDGVPSVLALGAETARPDASILLQLSFLDPQQFADNNVGNNADNNNEADAAGTS